MGAAVLLGLLEDIYTHKAAEPAGQQCPAQFTNLIACTNTEKSAAALRQRLGSHASRVKVLHGRNVEAMKVADVIVLGVKPYMASNVLRAPDVAEALKGKLVISMMAGVDLPSLRQLVGSAAPAESSTEKGIYFARAIPNLAATHRKSSTVLEELDETIPPELSKIPKSLFDRVGHTKIVPSHLVDLATVFNTACMTMMSVALDGLLDGCVMAGMKRHDAMDIAVHGVSGLAAMLADGTHPAVLRESAASPRGCTIQTLVSLDKDGVRGSFADALYKGVQHLQKPK